jgi:hypothetical protein
MRMGNPLKLFICRFHRLKPDAVFREMQIKSVRIELVEMPSLRLNSSAMASTSSARTAWINLRQSAKSADKQKY